MGLLARIAAALLVLSALGASPAMAQLVLPDGEVKSMETAPHLEGLCQKGDGVACLFLGETHAFGLATTFNQPEAVAAWKKACDANVAQGCIRLGDAQRAGLGVKADGGAAAFSYAKAAKLLSTRCETGKNPLACTLLGDFYANGRGARPRDTAKAFALNDRTCTQLNWAPACEEAYHLLVLRGSELTSALPRKAEFNALAVQKYEGDCDAGRVQRCAALAQFGGLALGAAKVQALYQKACDGLYGPACSALAIRLQRNAAGDAAARTRMMNVLLKGCNAYDGLSCEMLADIHLNGQFGASQDAAKGQYFSNQACSRGRAASCHVSFTLANAKPGSAGHDPGSAIQAAMTACTNLMEESDALCVALGKAHLTGGLLTKSAPAARIAFERALLINPDNAEAKAQIAALARIGG